MNALQMNLVFRRIPSGTTRDHDNVARFEGVLGDPIAAEATGITPFGGERFHPSLLGPGTDEEDCVWAPELEFLHFAFNGYGLVFEVIRREGMMGVGGDARKDDRDRQGQQCAFHKRLLIEVP